MFTPSHVRVMNGTVGLLSHHYLDKLSDLQLAPARVSMSMRRQLRALPDEVLICIFRQLIPALPEVTADNEHINCQWHYNLWHLVAYEGLEARLSLLRLCLVSKSFYRCAKPILDDYVRIWFTSHALDSSHARVASPTTYLIRFTLQPGYVKNRYQCSVPPMSDEQFNKHLTQTRPCTRHIERYYPEARTVDACLNWQQSTMAVKTLQKLCYLSTLKRLYVDLSSRTWDDKAYITMALLNCTQMQDLTVHAVGNIGSVQYAVPHRVMTNLRNLCLIDANTAAVDALMGRVPTETLESLSIVFDLHGLLALDWISQGLPFTNLHTLTLSCLYGSDFLSLRESFPALRTFAVGIDAPEISYVQSVFDGLPLHLTRFSLLNAHSFAIMLAYKCATQLATHLQKFDMPEVLEIDRLHWKPVRRAHLVDILSTIVAERLETSGIEVVMPGGRVKISDMDEASREECIDMYWKMAVAENVQYDNNTST